MDTSTRLLCLCLSLLGTSCRTVVEEVAPVAPEGEPPPIAASDGVSPFPLFPSARGDLVLEWSDTRSTPSLLDLLTRYADLTGQILILGPRSGVETRQLLQRTTLPVTGPLRVPQQSVQPFVEGVLAGEFVLAPKAYGELRLLAIHGLRTAARTMVAADTIVIPATDLPLARAHPTVLFTVLLNLPNVDVRVLSNALRQVITEPNLQRLVPVAAGSFWITGPGPWVADVGELVLEVEARQSTREDPVVLRVLPLSHAEASNLAPLVRAVQSGVVAQPVASRNVLVVVCPETVWPVLRDLVATLDVE